MSLDEKENGSGVGMLRAQIKRYEKDFLHANGRKPERADIKKDASIGSFKYQSRHDHIIDTEIIAAKYKAYQLATRPASLTSTPQKRTRPSTTRDARSEKPEHGLAATPRKQTACKSKRADKQQIVLSPVPGLEPTPEHIRLQLGPTPQRNGQVLGLFDMIASTPSKNESAQSIHSELLVAGTPSKPVAMDSAFSKTPQSSSKRFFLDTFTGTPLKREREDEVETSSASKRKFATPSFLRRRFPLGPFEEDGIEAASGMPAPFRKRGLVRSLSTIIQGLRQQEEDRMDDDWDVLNEIEQEQQDDGATTEATKLLVQDSQPGDMPLGPDQAPESSEDEEAPGRGGDRPRKPWKKKGLKRQTRRVIMRPVKHKAGKEGDVAGQDDGDAEVPPETQPGEKGSGDEEYGDLDEVELAGIVEQQKKGSGIPTVQDDISASKPKPGRKVNELAHANFRKLKIKSKNSNGSGRGGRKFGGRR